MSNALEPINTSLILDPLLAVNEKVNYAITKGGLEYSYRNFPANSYSQTNVQFNVPPPSMACVVDKEVYTIFPIRFNFTCTNPTVGLNCLNTLYDAPRAYPIAQSTSNLNININDQSANAYNQDYIDVLMRFNQNLPDVQEAELSLTPCYQDNCQTYADLSLFVRNPLGSYGDQPHGSQMARGGFPMRVVSNTQNAASVECYFCEPLFCSPLSFGRGRKVNSGFLGVQNMIINMNISDLNRMWSHSDHSTISNFTVSASIFAPPSILFKYATPSLMMSLPAVRSYPYTIFERFPSATNVSIASNATTRMTTANIQFTTIPSRIYLFARQSNGTRTFADSDTYASLDRVNLTWALRQGLLSDCSQQQLYQISMRNGCNLSWTEWSGLTEQYGTIGTNPPVVSKTIGLTGSLLCLRPGIDFQLGEDDAAGKQGQYTCQIAVDVKNLNQYKTIEYTLYIVSETNGVWQIMDGRSVPQTGVISKADIINVINKPSVDFYDVANMTGQGGAFIDNAKAFGKKALSALKTGCDVVNKVSQFVGEGQEMQVIGGARAGRATLKQRLNANY